MLKLRWLTGLLGCGLIGLCAEAVELIVVPPVEPVRVGQQVTVTILFHGTAEQLQQFEGPPAELRGVVRQGEQGLPVSLQRMPDESGLASDTTDGVARVRYRLSIPEQTESGPVILQVDSLPASPAYLLAVVPELESSEAVVFLDADSSKDDDLGNNDFLGSILAYHPTYFIAGADTDDAKIQLSFKYQFINKNSTLARQNEWLRGFYFAYTQLSLWDLKSESLPFEDTNFIPELFYQFNDVNLPILNQASRADLQLGLLHESNGREGDDSRSLNYAYLEPSLYFELDNGYELSLKPRLWAYFGDISDNENIKDFRGNASLTATFGKRESFQIEAYLRGNPGTGNGAVQLDVSYPLTRATNNALGFYLYTQFFRGFGESLLDFDQRDTRFRIGLGLVR